MYVLLLNFIIMGDFLNKFLSNVLGFVFGKPAKESLGMLSDGNNYLGNYFKQATGAGLTDAEKEANAFTASREDLAWNRQMEASNTAFQRQVADMQAAGINPMLAASGSGGSSVPSAQAQGSVSPSAGDLGSALQFALGMKSQNIQKSLALKELNIKERLANAEIEWKTANTRGQNLYNDFFEDTAEIRKILLGDQHERNGWERKIGESNAAVRERAQALAEKNASHYNDYLDKLAEKAQKDIDNNDLQRAVLEAVAREKNADAAYKNAMLSVDKAYREAQTESERNQAELLAVEARIKNGIYTPDYIKSVCTAAKVEAEYKRIEEMYHRGDYSEASKDLQKVFRKLEHEGAVRGNFTVFNTTERNPGVHGLPGQ